MSPIPESVCWINDKSIPPEFASIQEPLGNATYAVLGEDNDVAGKSMVIMGDGPIGLFAVAVARAVGVTKIIMSRPEPLQSGDRPTNSAPITSSISMTAQSPTARPLSRITPIGYGADIVSEMAGVPAGHSRGIQASAQGRALFRVRRACPVAPVELDYNNAIVFKGCQIHGINGRKMFDTWYRVRNLLASKRLDISPVVTHKFALEDYEKGFAKLMELPREVGKVVLFPDKRELEAARKRGKK